MTPNDIKTMDYLAEGKFCDDASMKTVCENYTQIHFK